MRMTHSLRWHPDKYLYSCLVRLDYSILSFVEAHFRHLCDPNTITANSNHKIHKALPWYTCSRVHYSRNCSSVCAVSLPSRKLPLPRTLWVQFIPSNDIHHMHSNAAATAECGPQTATSVTSSCLRRSISEKYLMRPWRRRRRQALYDHYNDDLFLLFLLLVQKSETHRPIFEEIFIRHRSSPKWVVPMVAHGRQPSQFHFYGKVVIVIRVLIMHKIHFVLNYSGTWTPHISTSIVRRPKCAESCQLALRF